VISKTQPDDVSREDVGRIAHDAAAALRGHGPIEAALGPVNVFPDALILEVHDEAGGLTGLRNALAPVVADAFGLSDAQYLPHVTIAMFASADASAPLRRVLPSLRERPRLAATLGEVELARWWFTGVDEDALPERDPVRTYRLRG
jgi:2'-5' RNA ligase